MSYFHEACVAYWPTLERAEEPVTPETLVSLIRTWAHDKSIVHIERAVILLRDFPGNLNDVILCAVRHKGSPATIDAFLQAVASFLHEYLPDRSERICPGF